MNIDTTVGLCSPRTMYTKRTAIMMEWKRRIREAAKMFDEVYHLFWRI